MTAPSTATAPAALPPEDRPDQECSAYKAMLPDWELCRIARGGTDAIRKHAAKYLPRFGAEEIEDWQARVNMTTAFDALNQTIGTMVGLAGGNAPVLEKDVPPELALLWENIDGEGTHGDIFVQECLDRALELGHHLILTDAPPPNLTATVRDQRAQGFRPYLVHIRADQVINWRVGKRGGHRYVSQITFRQKVERAQGRFGARSVTQYEVFNQEFDGSGTPFVRWERWTEGEGGSLVKDAEIPRLPGPRWIPIAVVYGGDRIDILQSVPPLRGLAHSNIRHTQVESDFAAYLHLCGKPTPVFIGRDKVPGEDLVLGRGVDVAMGGDAKLLEMAGNSLSAMRETKKDLEQQMVAQGLTMLQREAIAPETAFAHRLDKTRHESKLGRSVRSVQDGVEASLGHMAQFLRLPDGGSLTIRREFGSLILTDAELETVRKIRENGDLTLETFLALLKRKGGSFEDLDPAKEAAAVRREEEDPLT